MKTPSQSVLRVENAVRSFGETQALRGASFELRQGEFLGFLGPNGAGKTTLLRSIVGRVRLDGGSIAIQGETLTGEATADRERRRELGLVPQEVALYPTLTARENLECWARLHGVDSREARQRVDWALDWTDLRERAGDQVGTFSGGMKRRLNLACGVLHQPRIVLLDEPTVGVDPQSRQRIWEMLAGLKESGASLLLTTHQLDEAQTVCQRIVIIDHGKVRAEGSFDELVRSTLGSGRRVVVEVAGDLTEAQLSGAGLERLSDFRYYAQLDDVPRSLGPWLEDLRARGIVASELSIEAQTLQSVFLALTGRELRE